MGKIDKKFLIKNGIIVTPEKTQQGDLLVCGETIAEIGLALHDSEAEVIDAAGHYVLPGGIDVHTHFHLDVGIAVAQDDFFTGTLAAAMGGTTTIVDHPGFGPKGCSLFHQIDTYHEYARGEAVIDYSFHGVLQHFNEKIAAEIPQLVEQGISSMKVYMTYGYRFNDTMLENLFKVAAENDMIVAVHAEDDKTIKKYKEKFISQGKTESIYHALSRPVQAEASAVKKVVELAAKAGAAVYIVHLSTQEGLDHIKRAQAAGERVFAETCPQYLLLDEDRYRLPEHEGLKYLMSPPLRARKHQAALWQGLAEGTISVVATDHCPFDFSLKKKLGAKDFSKCPGGAPGVESRIPLLFSEGVQKGRLSVEQFARVSAENPAKIMGLYPQKGQLRVGSDADIVIINPDSAFTMTKSKGYENVDYHTYEGFRVLGCPTLTMVRGSVVVRDGIFVGNKGFGRFIKRKIHNKTELNRIINNRK